MNLPAKNSDKVQQVNEPPLLDLFVVLFGWRSDAEYDLILLLSSFFAKTVASVIKWILGRFCHVVMSCLWSEFSIYLFYRSDIGQNSADRMLMKQVCLIFNFVRGKKTMWTIIIKILHKCKDNCLHNLVYLESGVYRNTTVEIIQIPQTQPLNWINLSRQVKVNFV